MRKININAQITNITESEMAVLKALFGERIAIEEVKKSGRKSAPKKPEDHKVAEKKTETKKATETKKVAPANKATETEEKPKVTRAQAIKAWKIEKYGSEEAADAVQDFANEVAAEWRAKKRETGKNVVGHSEYKTKLYEEAYKRYLASQKKGA